MSDACGGVISALSTGEALLREGVELLARRRVRDALRVLDEAEIAGADGDACAGARWQCSMLLGDYERAWRESDRVRASGADDPHRFWDGSDITGKRVMLRSLHGFGDAVQYLRYVPLLEQRAAKVTVEIAPELVKLAPFFDGAGDVITWGSEAPVQAPPWEVQVEVAELPYLFRSRIETLPSAPYLHLSPKLLAEVGSELPRASGARVGLVWTSSSWDRSRSIPFPLIEDLLGTPGIEFWSLQTAADNDAWRTWSAAVAQPLRVAGESSAERTAAFVAQMDLVISVDTFAAHLAGAMGRPVWLLLKPAADWRWMIEREDSPWYPTMRLFRARSGGEWGDVLCAIREALCRWIKERGERF